MMFVWWFLIRLGTLLVVITTLAVVAPRPALATVQNEPETETGTSRPVDPMLVFSLAGDDPSRREAGRAVLRLLTEPSPPPAPAAWLSEDPAASLRFLVGMAESQAEIEALAGALIRALRTGENGEARWVFESLTADARSATLGVLARSQEAAACQVLVAWLEAAPAAQRQPIAASLHAMTGRDDLAASPQAWRQWLGRHQHLPPLAWRGLLAEGLHRRAERLALRERDLVARLVESTRRFYTSLAPADRSGAMASLLADTEPAVRLLATDLLLRDLERGISPGPEATVALSNLLNDPLPSIRQASALLIDRIVPEGSAARLSVALRRETEPEVATVMLRAYRRAPDPAAIDALLRWLEHGEPTSAPAMRALLALLETGYTPSDDQRDRVLAAILPHDASTILPSAVHVLARLGGMEGQMIVRELLDTSRAEVRRAAADAVLVFPDAVEDLLAAAEQDSSLLQRAADAVARHRPWALYLRQIAKLEMAQPADAASDQALPITASLATFLPVGERLAAAQALARIPLAVRAILGQPQREQYPAGPQGDRAFARALSLLGLPTPAPERVEAPDTDHEPDDAATGPR